MGDDKFRSFILMNLPTNALNKIFLLLHREILRLDGGEAHYAEKFKFALRIIALFDFLLAQKDGIEAAARRWNSISGFLCDEVSGGGGALLR